jgi:transcriptional regulator with XRE-family HTH domain
MPRSSKITPKKLARVRAARAEGKGLRAAAKEAGVSHQTIANWERRQPKRKAPSSAVATEAAAILDAPLPQPGDPEALSQVRARAELVRGLLERLTPAVAADEYPATNYVTLARYGDELARVIAELTPPSPKDPNEDRNVLDAERVLLARIASMVGDAEAEASVSQKAKYGR